jgi:endonuclease/exonuclease/phosphatase family metal-dependent hydrolase
MNLENLSRGARNGLGLLALPALTVTLGLQLLRVFIPGLAWYLRDTLGASPAVLGTCTLGTFLLGSLATPLHRLLGRRTSLFVTAGVLAAVRLAEQLVRHPAADFGLSALGTALFLIFVPLFAAHARATEAQTAATRIAGGLAAGLTLDTAIRGFAGSLDLSWWHGLPALLTVLAEGASVVLLLHRERAGTPGGNSESDWLAALPLGGIGPFLFLQAMVYQNQGWIAQVAGLTPWAGLLLGMMGNLTLGVGLWIGLSRPYALRPFAAGIGTVCLMLSAGAATQLSIAFAFNLLIAQFVFGWSLAAVAAVPVSPSSRSIARTSMAHNLGMLLFLMLVLAYYLSLEFPLPISRESVLIVAAAAFGLAVFIATARLSLYSLPAAGPSMPFAAIAALFLTVLVFALVQPALPSAAQPTGGAVRVMTFNIHSAYDSQGVQDPEAIARVIESSQSDIIALQEVSRGWLLDGSTDLVAWLAGRLGMQVVFRGTADPVWGNALLTRLPIVESGSGSLPLAGTRLPRGYLWATLDAGMPKPLTIIATHLHHVETEHGPRLAQVPVLLDLWAGRPFSILLGDLNSEPDYEEMRLISDASFVDSWAEAGQGRGLTWPAVDPFERIDWIWHTPDLRAVGAVLTETLVSDHLPLLVRLEAAP